MKKRLSRQSGRHTFLPKGPISAAVPRFSRAGAFHFRWAASTIAAMIRYPEVFMGFRSLAQSLVVTVSIAAAAATPVFAQQPAPSPAAPTAPA
ncbi:invasion associated locus B family protein, partial [Rhizobium leguminosarum bv. viciae]|nr:invasion associated locus B family protein [Rhizobium leguminosarum bv. viciae]